MDIKKIAKYPVNEIKRVYKCAIETIAEKIDQWNDYNNYMPDICDVELETDD